MTDEILTPPEVAQLLKIAEKTVSTMPRTGEPPAFTEGGQRRVGRTDLDAWIGTEGGQRRVRRTDLDAWIGAESRRASGEEASR